MLIRSVVEVSPIQRRQRKHQPTDPLSISLRIVKTLQCGECSLLGVLTQLMRVSPIRIYNACMFRCGSVSHSKMATQAPAYEPPFQLTYGQSKLFVVRVFPTRRPKFAGTVDGIIPTRRQHRKLTKALRPQPTMSETKNQRSGDAHSKNQW